MQNFLSQIKKREKEKSELIHKELNSDFLSGPPGTRTLDTLIKSQVLYQLS